MDRVAGSGQGQAWSGTHDWLMRSLSLWLVPAGYRPPGGHRAAPWIWPCKRGTTRRQRVTGPHEPCGKRLAGMLPKEKGAPWRRSNFPRAGTSNTPPALPLALAGDASQSEALAGDLEKRFPEDTFVKFTYVPVLRALAALGRGKPADSVERSKSLGNMSWRRMASTSSFILAVCTRPMCAARLSLPRAGMRKRRPSFRRSSIIAVLWGSIPLACWRTCNSVECSLYREIRPGRKLPMRLSSHFGRMRTPTSRS